MHGEGTQNTRPGSVKIHQYLHHWFAFPCFTDVGGMPSFRVVDKQSQSTSYYGGDVALVKYGSISVILSVPPGKILLSYL